MKWLPMLVLLCICTILSGCGDFQHTFDRDLTVASERYCQPSRYITFTNNSKVAGTLEGWTIGEFNSSPSLPDIVLEPGESLKVWSGKGTHDEGNYYMMREWDTWALPPRPTEPYMPNEHFIFITKEVERGPFWARYTTYIFANSSVCL